MDILELSNTLTKEDFKESLKYINQANEKDIMPQFLDLANAIHSEGTDLASAIYYAWYDLIINSDTSNYNIK